MARGAALTTILNACVCVCWGLPESTALTVKLLVPSAVGVPVMPPVAVFRERPVGRLPLARLQVIGSVPPVACTVCE